MSSSNLEKKIYYSELFEIYKPLFTEKQKNYFIGYYDYDLSLSELATNYNVSKNAVYDNVTRVIASLDDYEKKLNVFEKSTALNKCLEKANDKSSKDELQEIIKKIGEINGI